MTASQAFPGAGMGVDRKVNPFSLNVIVFNNERPGRDSL
jgi:hypothetical protein